jgi:hypothetical protein
LWRAGRHKAPEKEGKELTTKVYKTMILESSGKAKQRDEEEENVLPEMQLLPAWRDCQVWTCCA